MTITVDFEDLGDETRMRMTQTNFADAEARDLHNQGWSSSMISLERHLDPIA